MRLHTTVFPILAWVVTRTFSESNSGDFCGALHVLEESSCCQRSTVEELNTSIHPPLMELLSSSFFRYYKINLSRPCPFWKEDLMCTSQGCSIATIQKDPNGWEAQLSDIHFPTYQLTGSIFKAWEFDEDDFCLLDREGENGVYVDLIENPERFTGYSGPSANRIWRSIYEENCFSGNKVNGQLSETSWDQCVERQLFYRVISGLHASISVHLSDRFYNQKMGQWGQNLPLYQNAVGNHPDRLNNVYLSYMLLYRAVCRLAEKIDELPFGDLESKEAFYIKELFSKILSPNTTCPSTFDSCLFSSSKPEVIDEFKEHFRNVTKIMDCISCERCRLWGKIQITGMGTALKILSVSGDRLKWTDFKLRRSELIALVNTLGRFSESIDAILRFAEMSSRAQALGTISYLTSLSYKLLHPFAILSLLALLVLGWSINSIRCSLERRKKE